MHDYLYALIGGVLLGIAVVGYLYIHGRIAGISGLISQVLQGQMHSPAVWFLLGLFITPFFYVQIVQPDIELSSHPILLIIAGLVVCFGTRIGSGCTSGHGICGMSRLSIRSIVATCTFMIAGFITVYILRHLMQVGV